jgi:hypothetical protein
VRGTGRYGVQGEGSIGVRGMSSAIRLAAVHGEHTGTNGLGVLADASGPTGIGVLGRNPTGVGVRGEGKTGVRGASPNGYGGVFKGGKAHLFLPPGPTAGAPTTGTHSKGELYMDSAAKLWLCVVNGTPGTWQRLATVSS